nr:uncharacterized protein LOC129446126 isoform X3 [Misgurnus anguillicaudatus]
MFLFTVFALFCQDIKMENKQQQWCIVQFKNGGTEIVPQNWLHCDKLSWPPFTNKESSKIHAAVKNCLQPDDDWIIYEPVRRLISRDTYDDARRSLQRYLKDNCDTTDMQSEGEFDGRPKRKLKSNSLYNKDVDSEEEGTVAKKKKFPPAPRIMMPVQGLSAAGAQCGSLHSDVKAALSLEKDVHHHEPSLHQLLPAVQGLSAAGAQCGSLHSDVKAALSLEKDVHHHEPSLHQLLPAVKDPGSSFSSKTNHGTTWNDKNDLLMCNTERNIAAMQPHRGYDEQVDCRPFNEMHPNGRNVVPSHSMGGGYYSMYNDPLFESPSAITGPSDGHFIASLTHGQRTESPDSRQIIKDIAYSKLAETLAELVSEVKELRQEVQGFMRRQLPMSPPLPLSLPLNDLNELEKAEEILQTEDARRIMVGRYAIVGGASAEVRVRRMLACTLTNKLASQMNWAGKKVKDGQKQKTAFKDTRLKICMFDALQQQMKAEKKEASEYVFAVAVQKWLRYAPERLGGIARGVVEQ